MEFIEAKEGYFRCQGDLDGIAFGGRVDIEVLSVSMDIADFGFVYSVVYVLQCGRVKCVH